MIENLHFLNQKWFWPVLLGSALIWLFFLWKEKSKKLHTRFFLNGLIALIAITALALMALKPVTSGKVETNAGVLLTDSYAKERLDSLKRTDSNLKVIPYIKNKGIGSTLDSVAPLFVLGDGVRTFDFWQFKNVPAQYLGSETPKGIIALAYDGEITVGKALSVRGRYNAPKSGHYLVLATPDSTGLDSLALNDLVRTDFELSTEMKVEGSYTFSLIEKDSIGKTISIEPLPVTVQPKTPMKVLMINSFPTFESKYLKNYLAESGHELTVRSLLTKDNYKFEYYNTDSDPIYAFSRKRLEAFDILLIDTDSYVNISGSSKNALQQAVEKDGLGVFIQPDNQLFSIAKRTSNFEFVRDKNVKINLEKWPKLKVDAYPFRFKTAFGLENIRGLEKSFDKKIEIRTAYRRMEKGRIGTTTIQNTYKWILDGHLKAYQEFWSEVVGVIGKRKEVSTVWANTDKLIFRNMPYAFEMRTRLQSPEIFETYGGEVPIEQHPDFAELWTGTVYPQKTGWNELSIASDSTSTHRFFVLDSTNYKPLVRHTVQLANNRFFNRTSSTGQSRTLLKQIPSIWFLIVFIVAIGWLWVSPKILRE